MSSALDVEAIARNLNAATSFDGIFGVLPPGDHKTQRASVRQVFAYLAKVVHPDHVHDAPDLAETAFEHLRALFNAAEEAIIEGTYDKPFPAGIRPGAKPIADFFELQSRTETYRCNNAPYRTGDFSVLYRAQVHGNDVLVKIAKEPPSNVLLETEANRLKSFRSSKAALKTIHRFLPELIDTFMIPAPGGKQFRANVMSFNPAMLSLTDIMTAFSGSLIPQQAAWIVRRVMAQTCAAAMAGLVHASITPDHVLVDPIKHEPCHIGWLHATETTRLTMIVDRWKDWYPPEIFDKAQVPTHQTDIYMAGKTCIWLFGGSGNHLPDVIPESIRRILLGCVVSDPKRRPTDGLKVMTDLTTAIRSAWGRSYKPLLLPL